jgi:hypothetical protein
MTLKKPELKKYNYMRSNKMMPTFLLILLSLNGPWALAARTLDFSSLNPPAQIINGVEFPRLKELKYRGVPEVQMDRKKAIAAMLGADESMESIIFSAMKLLLMKERFNFYPTVKPAMDARGLSLKVEAALLKNNDEPFTLDKARAIAFKILEDDLKDRLNSGYLLQHNIDYKSGAFETFPQDVIFSTNYIEVANIYSRFITIIKDQPSQMLDLNFWNWIKNGSWVLTSHKWVDRGEFISPILIEAQKIVGFIEYLTQVPDYTVFRVLPKELDFAFIKSTVGGEDVVLIFDGKTGQAERAQAIVESQGKYYLANSQFNPDADIPKTLKPTRELARLIGIIKLCPQKSKCSLDTPIFNTYPRSTRHIDNQTVDNIIAREIKGKKPRFFFMNGTLSADEEVSDAYVKTFPKKAELMAALEKEASFKSYFRIPEASKIDENSLSWDLGGRKLPNGSAIYLDIPDSFRKKRIKKVTLLERQDVADNSTPLKGRWDSSPAYTGIEIYALTDQTTDNWRYPNKTTHASTPKNSLFSDIRTEEEMIPQVISDWSTTFGDAENEKIADKFSVGAVRLLGLGTDPATVYKLDIEFE